VTEVVAVEKPLFEKVPGQIPNGIFTCIGPKGHRTVKVKTVNEIDATLRGKRIVYVMTGADNLFDYTGVAFLDTVDGKDTLKVWKRMQGTALHKIVLAWLHIMGADAANGGAEAVHEYGKPDEGWEAYSIEEAKHCMVCNRLLTNPKSIARGIGPTHLGEEGEE